MKVYTKTGDAGETGLVGGKRVSKGDARIDLYGDVDELNSRIGFALSLFTHQSTKKSITEFLHTIQSALFDLGSNLACEPQDRTQFKLPSVSEKMITDLESKIDVMESTLAPLKNFILPGGSQIVSAFHLCRTAARSVERKMIHFSQERHEQMPDHALAFMNRLSDYFFVLARHLAAEQNEQEILWKAQP